MSDDMYVPTLRWRQGEYQALMQLSPPIKSKIVPLIFVPEVEFDFELRQPRKSVHEHVFPFPGRFRKKWRPRPAWITLDEKIAVGRMSGRSHVFDYIFDNLRLYQACGIPAAPLDADADTLAAAQRAIAQDQYGFGIIVRLEDLMTRNPKRRVVKVLTAVSAEPEDTDLIVDLRAPNFEPYAEFAKALVVAMRKMGDLNQFRNLVLVSTAIPESFANVAKGTDELPRHDWLFYQAFLADLPNGMRRPNYGDYTIVHPNFVARDMRLIKAAGKVVYTTSHSWATRKGGAFRGNEVQMHTHCEEIVKDTVFQFQGAGFSYGDAFIARCAAKLEGPSNLTRWKSVAINHHMTMVTNDLAKLTVASLRP
ncbi:MAG: beta family protein [Rhodobacteraceae bacterium]|nr:beta family protein [Paracoccaceae bacterium]